MSIDVERKRNVIERPLTDHLDVNGWDIRKAIQLFRKSNPPLLEWLQSPIVYVDRLGVATQLRTLLPACYSPVACMYHYLHMARGNYRAYLQGERVWVKKYFYVLRPLLAVRWIEQGRGVVPIEFPILVEQVVDDVDVKREICDLVERKRAGDELDRAEPIPTISRFIDNEIKRLESIAAQPPAAGIESEQLDQLFRMVVSQAWQITGASN